jgi:3-oxoadipate enol-lactonase
MIPVAVSRSLEGPLDAPAVVLGSSLGTTRAIWEPQRPLLAAERRVVSYDHRGHGESPVPPAPYSIGDLGGDVLALLDALGLASVAYCGLSLGGMVGLWLAANAPERIESLIVICSSAHPGAPERWAQRAATVRAAGTTEPIVDAVMANWFTADFATHSPQRFAAAKAMLLSSPVEGYVGCCNAIEGLDLRRRLPQITAPTLVISAAGDGSLPPEHGREIATAIPGARFELLPHGAHIANVEEESAVNTLISEHLAVGTHV